MLVILLLLSGCAHHKKIPVEKIKTVYQAQGIEESLILRHAPLFLIHNNTLTYNRIGRPSAKYDDQGIERIYVDTEHPVIYYQKRNFTTQKGQYINLIYRIHFPKVPFSLLPFHLNAGNNVGLLVVITLDSAQRPVLVTTVGTCGCYRAIVPTSFLSNDALPMKWQEKPIDVYGETLPARLNYANKNTPKLMIYIRPGVHRVMDMEVVDERNTNAFQFFTIIPAPLKPVQELERLPLDDITTSFYHDTGVLKGHVKGSVKPWESIFLSLMSLDLFVGTDKIYGDSKETGNPFYTSLKPWNRNASDMWDFGAFLEFWGWRL